MTDTVKISPAKDRRVRHPGGQLLEPKTEVAWSTFWQRRADAGDITVHEPKPSKADADTDQKKD